MGAGNLTRARYSPGRVGNTLPGDWGYPAMTEIHAAAWRGFFLPETTGEFPQFTSLLLRIPRQRLRGF